MTIQIYEHGKYVRSFDDTNEVEVVAMANDVNSPLYDGMTECITAEEGWHILHWPIGEDKEENDEYGYSHVGIDFGPSNPWDAPGMCASDFIR